MRQCDERYEAHSASDDRGGGDRESEAIKSCKLPQMPADRLHLRQAPTSSMADCLEGCTVTEEA